jgi:single-strand DNA-binding protein
MTKNAQAVLNLRLATNESYQDRNQARQERTEWHTVVVWGKRAEALGTIIRKGARLFIEGRIQTTPWQDRDGKKMNKTEIVATNIVLFPDGQKSAVNRKSEPAPAGDVGGGYGDDDIPF